MRIIAVSMVKNEMDVVESFVRHTLSFADGILIANHDSTDRTGEILESLRREGLPIQVFPHHSIAQEQSVVMTALMRRAIEGHHADLVLPLDADEFLLGAGPGHEAMTPRPVLETLDPERLYDVYLVDCETIDMESGHDVFLLERPYRRTRVEDLSDASDPDRRKIIVGRGCAERLRLRITQGNHYGVVEQVGPSYQSKVTGEHLDSICLAHFPCRGLRQYLSKVVVGWISSVSVTTRYTNMARHWKTQFDRFARGEDDVLMHLPPNRREDASPAPSEAAPQLRYTAAGPGGVEDVLREVAVLGERLAHFYAERVALEGNPGATVILLCRGGRERLLRSLSSISALNYANKELIFMGSNEPELIRELISAASAVQGAFTSVRQVERPEELREAAKGKYIQWVMPGDELPQGNLRVMISIMEMVSSLVCWNNGIRAEGGIERKELIIQDVATWSGQEALSRMIAQGRLMSGGISGALFHRQAMEAINWAASYLKGERWAEFSLWNDLLPRVPLVSLLPLAPVRREAMTAEDFIWQQMDFMLALESSRRRGTLTEEQYQKRMQVLRENIGTSV